MLKKERLLKIQHLVNSKGIITVNEVSMRLGVSAMTIRRDLEELAQAKALQRIHGGAQSLQNANRELSRAEKTALHVAEKGAIAKMAASLVAPNETIFIGPGTTNEFLADYLKVENLRIVTNSLPVFQSFQPYADRYQLQLIGGTYRARSGAFVGSLTNDVLERLRPNITFVSANGIHDDALTDATPEEGQAQRIALKNADTSYVLADTSKLGRVDFYTFYKLSDTDGLICDAEISPEQHKQYSQFSRILLADRD